MSGTMSLLFATERQVAISAVRRACGLTSAVFNNLVKNETLVKGDKSPVTGKSLFLWIPPILLINECPVGDFSAQAIVNTILSRAFPDDPIVGEEDANDLRGDSLEVATLRTRVVDLAGENLAGELGLGEMAEWGLGPKHTHTSNQLLDAIDRGAHAGGPTGRAFWFQFPALIAADNIFLY